MTKELAGTTIIKAKFKAIAVSLEAYTEALTDATQIGYYLDEDSISDLLLAIQLEAQYGFQYLDQVSGDGAKSLAESMGEKFDGRIE